MSPVLHFHDFIHSPTLSGIAHSRIFLLSEQQHGTISFPPVGQGTIPRVKQEAGFHVRPGLFALMIKIISHEIKIPQFDHHQHPQQQERTHHQHGSQYRSRKIMFEKFDHNHSILSVYTLLPFRKHTESR